MQVTLSSRGDYAVRAVLDLAQRYGRGLRTARQIADAMCIPKNFLSLILADLVRAGVLTASVGRTGGYELARPPRAVSLLEVVEVAEGPIAVARCLLRGTPCEPGGYCAAHEAWASAQTAMVDRLRATSFAQLADANYALLGSPAVAGAAPRGRSRGG